MQVTVELLSFGSRVHTIVVEAQSREAAEAIAQDMMDAAALAGQSYRLLNRQGQALTQR